MAAQEMFKIYQNIEFILNGTLKVTGSNSGHITIVFENQYYDLLPSKITNNATVTIEGGKRVFVVSLIVQALL